MLSDFKKFALRGNLIDMATGIILGAAFGGIVKSLVDDIIMPPLGLLIGGVDFGYLSLVLKDASASGPAVAIRYGAFLNLIINFLIVAFAIYLLVSAIQRAQARMSPAEAAPPGPPPPQELLLAEIRDVLKARQGQV